MREKLGCQISDVLVCTCSRENFSPPPSPIFGQKAFFKGGVYILKPPTAGFLYARPPTPWGVFSGVGGCIKFGPVHARVSAR